MIHVITGGSGSGKSAYAEEESVKYQEKNPGEQMIYVATMVPGGKETQRKIQRHQRLRQGKGFETIECYTGVEKLAEKLQSTGNTYTLLLECMSNLVANELYMEEGAGEQAVEEILKGMEGLRTVCKNLVIVTNEVHSDGRMISKEMEHYKQVLGRINVRLAEQADYVTEVVYGIPMEVKR